MYTAQFTRLGFPVRILVLGTKAELAPAVAWGSRAYIKPKQRAAKIFSKAVLIKSDSTRGGSPNMHDNYHLSSIIMDEGFVITHTYALTLCTYAFFSISPAPIFYYYYKSHVGASTRIRRSVRQVSQLRMATIEQPQGKKGNTIIIILSL